MSKTKYTRDVYKRQVSNRLSAYLYKIEHDPKGHKRSFLINFQTDKSSFTTGDDLHFSIDVTNTGKYAGKEVVMLFSSDLVASLTPENRRLRAFKKVELQPGETQTVTLSIKGSDLAFVNSRCV